jgi:small subunit ribosomal protein S25e
MLNCADAAWVLNNMGGVKKKSLASMEKSQDSQDTAQDSAAPSKGKKAKEAKAAPQQKKQLSFLAPQMSVEQMVKSLTSLKAITVHGASRTLGVNASVATGVLRDLEAKKLLRRAGGFSGHGVWAVA